MKTALSNYRIVFCIALLWSLLPCDVFGQTPIYLERFICSTETSTELIYDDIKGRESDRICDAGTRMHIITTGDTDMATVTVSRMDNGPHRAKVNIVWEEGMSGIIDIEVYYERRENKRLGICDWEPWTYMYTYKVYKLDANPSGTLTGANLQTAKTETDESVFTFDYLPSPTYPASLRARTLKYWNGKENIAAEIIKSSSGYAPLSLQYYTQGFGSFELKTQIVDDCGKTFDGPQKTLTVHPSCYVNVASSVIITVTGTGVVPHSDGYEVIDENVNTLSIQGITDFASHYDWNVQDFGSDITFDGNTFAVHKKLGSYIIFAVPKNNRSLCPDISSVTTQIFVDGSDVVLEDVNSCPIELPTDFATKFPQYRISPNDVVFTHFSATVVSKRSITIKPGFTLALGAELILDAPPAPPQKSDPDFLVNFVEETSYNEFGQPLTQGRKYFDSRGLGTQTQYKNLTDGVIMATATIYDAYARPAIKTLPAPVAASTIKTETNVCNERQIVGDDVVFAFKKDFVRAPDGIYSAKHFDLDGEIDHRSSPTPLDPTQEKTLGWYYSTRNGTSSEDRLNEPLTSTTSYPYNRTIFSADGSGEVEGTTNPGDAFRMGLGKVVTTNNVKVENNDSYLNKYFEMRSELGLRNPSPAKYEGSFFKTIRTDENGQTEIGYQDNAGNILITLQPASQAKSYIFYNNAGQAIVSVSPNGVNNYESVPRQPFSSLDKNVYSYNLKGHLIEASEADAGVTKFLHRRDGQVRFSQNSIQTGRFAYTHFDFAGRAIESGEYSGGSMSFGDSEMMKILNNTGATGFENVGGTASNQIFTIYDEDAISLLQNPDKNIRELAQKLIDLNRKQRFVHGQVSCARNAHSATWHSYDESGRLEWTVQDVFDFGIKTLDYRYAATGDLAEVVYQLNNDQERFTHYYEYDFDGRLNKVYTTREKLVYDKNGQLTNSGVTYKDGRIDQTGPLALQATYDYYLHGPLKRVEYANKLQGVDYTYTVDGAIKSINDAKQSNDPGKDQDDVFGLTLEYYPNDFTSNSYNPGTHNFPAGNSDHYNGSVKGTRWHSPIDGNKTFAYAYAYDLNNELKSAVWGREESGVLVFDNNEQYTEIVGEKTSNGISNSYDLNGNIQRLQRKDVLGKSASNFKYSYLKNTNKLEFITNPDNESEHLREYRYDGLGQIVEQKNVKERTSILIDYDATGKATKISNQSGSVVDNTYDERGLRLSKTIHDEAGKPIFKTWYIRDDFGEIVATYETDVSAKTTIMQDLPVYGSERIGMFIPKYNQTFYELRDHIGNVRAVIGGPVTMTTIATMESERAEDENLDFIGLRRSNTSTNINHTPEILKVEDQTYHLDANEVIRLNNKPNGTYRPEPIGGGTILWVHPGDTIRAEVYSKYFKFNSSNHGVVTNIAAQVASSLAGVSTVIDAKAVLNSVSSGEVASLGAISKLEDDQPLAFLNGILFDQNMVVQKFDYDQLTKAAEMTLDTVNSDHEKLEIEFVPDKEGYLYLYVSNESNENMDVFFDDLRVTHVMGQVVAGGDYYPFGEEISDRRVTLEKYRHGYQGLHAEKDPETGWNHFQAREYDATIGRWLTTDPARQNWSSYSANGNNPISNVDPDGGSHKPQAHRGGIKEPKTWWQRTRNNISGNGFLNKAYEASQQGYEVFYINYGSANEPIEAWVYAEQYMWMLSSTDGTEFLEITDISYYLKLGGWIPPQPDPLFGFGVGAVVGGPIRSASLSYLRRAAVTAAWKLEASMVSRLGYGTRAWTYAEKVALLKYGKVPGFVGHHIKSVAKYPKWAADPRNIQFVKANGEHLKLHGGSWRNATTGKLINRK